MLRRILKCVTDITNRDFKDEFNAVRNFQWQLAVFILYSMWLKWANIKKLLYDSAQYVSEYYYCTFLQGRHLVSLSKCSMIWFSAGLKLWRDFRVCHLLNWFSTCCWLTNLSAFFSFIKKYTVAANGTRSKNQVFTTALLTPIWCNTLVVYAEIGTNSSTWTDVVKFSKIALYFSTSKAFRLFFILESCGNFSLPVHDKRECDSKV